MNTDEIKLKPCPFCGGRAYISISSVCKKLYIECEHKNCAAKPNTFFAQDDLYTQIEYWNRRYEDKKQITILGKKTNLWKGK